VVVIPTAQAPTGGGEDAAENMTWVLLGQWEQPTAKPLGDGSETVTAKGVLGAGKPLLSAQKVLVQVRTSQKLAQKVIERIDWGAIRALIAGN
jgi:hypothetical protein